MSSPSVSYKEYAQPEQGGALEALEEPVVEMDNESEEEEVDNDDIADQFDDAEEPPSPERAKEIDKRFSGERTVLSTQASNTTIRTYTIDNANFLIYLYENNKQFLTEYSINFFESKESSNQAEAQTKENLVNTVARDLLNNGTPCSGAQNNNSSESSATEFPPPVHFADPNFGSVYLNYLSNLTTSRNPIRKRKRKRTSPGYNAGLTHKIHKMKRTSVSYMLRQFGVPINVYYQIQECLSAGLKVLKKKELEKAAAAKQSDDGDLESDVEISAASYFTLYKHMCEWLLQHSKEGIFAYAFTVLTWNLGLPCGITSRIKLQQISMSSNGTAMKVQLPPNAGVKERVCLLYCNPFNPLICPFFALSIYLMAHPGIVSESDASYLFSSSSSDDGDAERKPSSLARYKKFLDRVMNKHRQDVLKLCHGLNVDNVDATTIHQGSHALLNSFSTTEIEDEMAGDDSEKALSTYRSKDYPSMPSFEFKGRVLAGLDPEEPDFQVWPPKFEIRTSEQLRNEDNAVVRPFWTGMFGITEISGFESVLRSLSACILYHHRHNQNFVKKFATMYKLDFVKNNPLLYAGIDTPDIVKMLRLPHVGPSPDIVQVSNAVVPREVQSSIQTVALDDLKKKVDLISKRLDRHEKSQGQLSTSLNNALKNVSNEIRAGVRDELRQYKTTERGLARANASMQELRTGIIGRATGGGGATAAAGGVGAGGANPALGPFTGAIGPDLTALHHLVLSMMSQMEARLNRFEERLVNVVSSSSAKPDPPSFYDNGSDGEDSPTVALQRNKSVAHGGMYYHKTESRGLSPVPDGWKYPKDFPIRHLFSRWFLPDVQNRLCPLRMLKSADVRHLKGRDGTCTMNDAAFIMRVFECRLKELGIFKDNPSPGDIAEWWQHSQGVVMDKIMQCPKISNAKKSRLNEKNFRQIRESYCAAIKHETNNMKESTQNVNVPEARGS